MPQNPLLGDFPVRGLPFEGRNDWFGRHPRLGQGLDNALIALSNMDEPSPTIGGNISNVARGFLSIGQTRRGLRQQEMQDEMAPQLAALGIQKTQADIDLSRAHADYYRKMPEERAATAAAQRAASIARGELSARPELMYGPTSNPMVGHRNYDEKTGEIKLVPDPSADPTPLIKEKHTGMLGGGLQGAIISNYLEYKLGGTGGLAAHIKQNGGFVDPKLMAEAQKAALTPGSETGLGAVLGAFFKREEIAEMKRELGKREDFFNKLYDPAAMHDPSPQQFDAKLGELRDPTKVSAFFTKRKQAQQGLRRLHGYYSMAPMDWQMQKSPADFLRENGFDPDTGEYNPPSAKPAANPMHPTPSHSSATPTTPTSGGLSPNVQAIIDQLKKP